MYIVNGWKRKFRVILLFLLVTFGFTLFVTGEVTDQPNQLKSSQIVKTSNIADNAIVIDGNAQFLEFASIYNWEGDGSQQGELRHLGLPECHHQAGPDHDAVGHRKTRTGPYL